ncbi:hypothetical protein U1Q18_017253 [Sarracenia purpurea var. burkii]
MDEAFLADPANKQASAPKKAHPGEDKEEDGASSGAPNHEPFSEAEALGGAVNHRLADQKKTKCCQSVRRRGIGSVHAVRSLVVWRLSAPMERTKAMRCREVMMATMEACPRDCSGLQD